MGPAHIAGMCAELLPSSQVMKSAALCVWKMKLFKISGTMCERYVSPVETAQLCMSSHRFGVSHMKLEAVEVEARSEIIVDALVPAGITRLHSERRFVT